MSHIKGEWRSRHTHSSLWSIPNFLGLPLESGYVLESPRFLFADATWCLRMFPYCEGREESDIRLVRLDSSVDEHELEVKFSIEGLSCLDIPYDLCFDCNHEERVVYTLSGNYISFLSDACFPYGTFTVKCELRSKGFSVGGVSEAELGGDSSIIRGGSKRKAVEEEAARMNLLRSDYKQLLESGEESGDVCLVVSGREFRAHRCILGARSPVFRAMFNHDTEERKTGRVVIDDLDPDCFHDFLEHVYTGRVEAFSDENAFGLYTAADKYDFQALKSDCVEYMQRTLSVDSFCDVVTLALMYHEEELKDLAVVFFKRNVGEIVRTVKWQKFMSDNSTQANEIFIKAF